MTLLSSNSPAISSNSGIALVARYYDLKFLPRFFTVSSANPNSFIFLTTSVTTSTNDLDPRSMKYPNIFIAIWRRYAEFTPEFSPVAI